MYLTEARIILANDDIKDLLIIKNVFNDVDNNEWVKFMTGNRVKPISC